MFVLVHGVPTWVAGKVVRLNVTGGRLKLDDERFGIVRFSDRDVWRMVK